jgi:hypothetical protein
MKSVFVVVVYYNLHVAAIMLASTTDGFGCRCVSLL